MFVGLCAAGQAQYLGSRACMLDGDHITICRPYCMAYMCCFLGPSGQFELLGTELTVFGWQQICCHGNPTQDQTGYQSLCGTASMRTATPHVVPCNRARSKGASRRLACAMTLQRTSLLICGRSLREQRRLEARTAPWCRLAAGSACRAGADSGAQHSCGAQQRACR